MTIDILLGLETKPNEYHGVVLILTDLENISSNEWNHIQMILEAFTNELKDMVYPNHHIFCVLICAWDPEYRSIILPRIQNFFGNRNFISLSNHFENVSLENKKLFIQMLIEEYQRICTEPFPKSLLDMMKTNQLSLSKTQRILHSWHFFHSNALVGKFENDIKQFSELYLIENTTETINVKENLQENTNQVLKGVFDEKTYKIVKDLDFYIFIPIQKPELFHSPTIHYDPRALLCGTSGTGKTHILNYFKKKYPEVNVNVEHLTALYSPYFGETEKRLHNKIEQMKLPGVFVLEGLELLSVQSDKGEPDSTHSTFHRRILVTLLLCLDGFHDTVSKRSGQLGFIGVSKLPPEHLDNSLTRPGRLERWFLL
ncbi:ribosome biogenesis protein SPATA5-like [Hylaeus volcanicus]|uniref:ribosome biogenesis protein SPATA5-like n=1 Tax=Hylaeus volcanicus TaxID=313075 RepID=UPI0023B816A2|nr:ribosome biogenesis protein SPATA5-like [Hylaeus volcanicus]